MSKQRIAMMMTVLLALAGAARASDQGDEFDILEGWTIKGDGTAEVRDGRLVAQGVTMSKTFRIDLDRFPFYAVKVDEAEAGYVIKAALPKQSHRDMVRTDRAGLFEDSFPVRGRGPTDVELHLFLSGGRFVIDYLRFAPAPARGPATRPAEAEDLAPLLAPAATEGGTQAWYVVNEELSLAVWKANGDVAAGWVMPSGLKVFSYCSDLYRIETLTNAVEAFEHDDVVLHATPGADGQRLDLVCRNPAFPGLEIRKSYWARAEPNVIAKRVEFHTDRDWRGVIHWAHDAALDPAFREGGFYNNRDYHPVRDPFIRAADIRAPTGQPEGQQVYFVSPRTGYTAASYRLRANDRIVGPWCYFTGKGTSGAAAETDQYFTPRGWQFKAHLDRLWPAANPSAEVHYTALPGDFSHFHRQFQALPEFAEANDMVAPEWVSEVKGQGPPSVRAYTGPRDAEHFNNLLDDGYALRMYPLGRNEGSATGWEASPISEEDDRMLGGLVQHVRANAPRIKLGIYSWLHSVSRGNPALAEHPDWFLRGKDGAHVVDNAGMYSRLLVPEHVEYVRRMIREAQTTYDMDYFYVDGGGFGRTDVDWPTLRVVQPYDYMRMYEGTRVDGRPSFLNAINGLRGFYNAMGFFEGFIDCEDWRAMAIKLYEVKLYQQPGTWSMPLYLSQNNRQQYVNYCVLLGLQPQADVARPEFPLIHMAHELVDLDARDVGLTPCWWLESTELEAYALARRGDGGFFVTLLNHAREAKEYRIAFDPARAGFDPDRPVYAYHLRTAPAGDLWANKLSEPEDRLAYMNEGWSPIMLPMIEDFEVWSDPSDAAARVRTVRAGIVELLGVTQTPGLIWSEAGHRRYFPAGATRRCRVRGARDDAAVRLEVDSAVDCEVGVLTPTDWNGLKVTVDGETMRHRRVAAGLAVVPVPAGRHELVALPTAGANGGERPSFAIEIPDRVARGQALTIRLTPEAPLTETVTGTVSLALGENPVYVSTGLTFAAGSALLAFDAVLPLSLAPGEYTARVLLEGLAGAAGVGPVEAAQPVTVLIDPIIVPAGWDAPENAVLREREIDRVFEYGPERIGYRVLRAFEQVSGKSPGNTATVDTGSYWNNAMWATIAAGMGEERTAGYGHAGVEIDNLRAFSANISFVRPPKENGREVFAVDPRAHVSFSVDFHTPAGYAKRVYFHVNDLNDTFGARNRPWWGAAAAPTNAAVEIQHHFFRGALLLRRSRWDLIDYAPAGWDGRVILGANVSMAAPGTRLFLRILPEARLREEAPGFAAETVGEERQKENYTYRPLKPILGGSGAAAGIEETNMVFSVSAQGPDAYALAGIREWNFLIPRLAIETEGTAFLAVDYLTGERVGKRVFALLGGEDAEAEAGRLRAIAELGPSPEPAAVIDLRGQVAAEAAGFDFGLGQYAFPGWGESSKRALFRVGALGPNGRAVVRVVANDDFWRF